MMINCVQLIMTIVPSNFRRFLAANSCWHYGNNQLPLRQQHDYRLVSVYPLVKMKLRFRLIFLGGIELSVILNK